MYTYTVTSDIEDMPELTNLALVQEEVDQIRFQRFFDLAEIKRYDPAVGIRCRVTRTDDDGHTQERGGALLQLSPLVCVSLDGENWC